MKTYEEVRCPLCLTWVNAEKNRAQGTPLHILTCPGLWAAERTAADEADVQPTQIREVNEKGEVVG